MSRPFFVMGDAFVMALKEAGAFDHPVDTVYRVIIDARVGEVLRVHVCCYGDEKMVEVIEAGGVDIVEKPA